MSDIWSLPGICNRACNFGTLRANEGICYDVWARAIFGRVPPRKDIPSNQKMGRKPLRFTPADIVRAIEGVEAAGLQICAVEITPTGAIKISTGARIDPVATTPITNTSTSPRDEAKPIKKRA